MFTAETDNTRSRNIWKTYVYNPCMRAALIIIIDQQYFQGSELVAYQRVLKQAYEVGPLHGPTNTFIV